MNTHDFLPAKTAFASNGLLEHALRGALGFGALWWAISISAERPIASLALAGLALLAFRGCPICWTIGLAETAWRAFRRPASTENS